MSRRLRTRLAGIGKGKISELRCVKVVHEERITPVLDRPVFGVSVFFLCLKPLQEKRGDLFFTERVNLGEINSVSHCRFGEADALCRVRRKAKVRKIRGHNYLTRIGLGLLPY